MKSKQLLRCMGNIDDRLIEEVGQLRNRKKIKDRKEQESMARKLLAFAAVAALIICSGTVGALAFSREIEVPVPCETVTFEDIGLTLILPDYWEGKYAVEKTETGEYMVYCPQIRGEFESELGTDGGGMLFYILCWEDQFTEEEAKKGGEWSFAKYSYIMTTKDGTYLLYYASDVQFTEKTEDMYRQLEAGIDDIRFVADSAI